VVVVPLLALVGCEPRPAPTSPGRAAANVSGPRPNSAGNLKVTVRFPLVGQIEVVLDDPDGIATAQLTGFLAAGKTWEASSSRANCATQVFLRTTTPPNHMGHAHRVIVTDCQGRPERGQRSDTSATEVWDIPAGDTPDEIRRGTQQIRVQRDTNPRVVDTSPGTKRFRAVMVAGAFNAGTDTCVKPAMAPRVRERLEQYASWKAPVGSVTYLQEAGATKAALTAAINAAKMASQPGDEFLLYYCDHGTNIAPDDPPVDEPDGADGRLMLASTDPTKKNDAITDDELTVLLTGFRRSVTITVIIEACHSLDFVVGTADLLNARDATNQLYDKDHLAIITTARATECATGSFTVALNACLARNATTTTADVNRDGVTTAQELFNCARRRVGDSQPAFNRGVGF